MNESKHNEQAKDHLTKILELMGVQATVSEQTVDDATVCYRIDCQEDDARVLIGRKGTTLDSLQFLLRQMCKGAQGEEEHFIIDVCDYRERRKETIVERAKKGAVAVLNGEYEEFSLPAMNSYERRIVHNYLHENFPDLQSDSRGAGDDRHIVIRYGGELESLENSESNA